jgi:hypothetical protein
MCCAISQHPFLVPSNISILHWNMRLFVARTIDLVVCVPPQVSKLEVRLAAMSSVLSAKETSDNILNNAELILTAVTEVRTRAVLDLYLLFACSINKWPC